MDVLSTSLAPLTFLHAACSSFGPLGVSAASQRTFLMRIGFVFIRAMLDSFISVRNWFLPQPMLQRRPQAAAFNVHCVII